jgi:hypothetical protein
VLGSNKCEGIKKYLHAKYEKVNNIPKNSIGCREEKGKHKFYYLTAKLTKQF